FGVTTFADGPSMLRYFEEDGNADLVLLDWRMPEVDGLEVLRRLRQMGETVPVVFLTVLSDNVYEEAALEGGAVDFVEKSRSLPILIRRIRLIIGGGRPAAAGEEADRTVRHGKLELRLD
ncbi:MAG: response regulator, partial [Gammaproteobacteria bacterium]|nr:response regulator [Gammaproteobacteria bacterium]